MALKRFQLLVSLKSKHDFFCLFVFLCQAAAKQNRSTVEQEPSEYHDSRPNTTLDINHYLPPRITECATTSEESLKEVPPPPPTGTDMASMPQQFVGNSSHQYGGDTSSARVGSTRVPMVTFEDEVGELVPSPRRKKKKKARTSEVTNTDTLDNNDYELSSVNAKEIPHPGKDKVDAAPPRKKKKKVKATASDSLPPVIVRRPLPQLKLNADN